MRPRDISGMRFGRLVAISCVGSGPQGRVWRFQCDCGNTTEVRGQSVINGRTRSCGCLRNEVVKVASLKHGWSGTAEHNIWMGMRQRCENPNSSRYHQYGGRGIKVCERWRSFEKFIADMGPRPSPRHEIDRVNNDGPYSPDNCRWATPHQQAKNKRTSKIIKFRGLSLNEIEWARRLGIKRTTIQHRLGAGWPIAQALGFEPRPEAERYRKCVSTT